MTPNITANVFTETSFEHEYTNNTSEATTDKLTDTTCPVFANIKASFSKSTNKISQSSIYKKAHAIALKIRQFTKTIFINLGAVLLLCINPIIFPISFTAGFSLNVAFEKFHSTLKIIQSKALAQPLSVKVVVAIACFYTPIAPVALLSSFYALRLGSELSERTPLSSENTAASSSTGIEK